MLSNLNDDCLLHIFQLLSLQDQLQLTTICERFEFLMVKYIWSKQYHDLHNQMRCLQPLDLQQYKQFFRLNQENIRKLQIDVSNNFAYVYNSNRLNNRPDYTFYFKLTMSNIKILRIKCPAPSIHDVYIEMLSKNCPKLEILDLGKSRVSGAYVEDIRSLQLITIGNKHIQLPFSLHKYENFLLD
ncbi:uncharacterized protein LOC111685938 [Lucilia cuprina]|uniref:uncharacterized protein LOC111685938 n=1 Tax=Lucilia cuprina TaxID=7375 RepID=UPI001F056CDC|nr:uncharacterized protein LOC111685938 [Lucilia cuprina]